MGPLWVPVSLAWTLRVPWSPSALVHLLALPDGGAGRPPRSSPCGQLAACTAITLEGFVKEADLQVLP